MLLGATRDCAWGLLRYEVKKLRSTIDEAKVEAEHLVKEREDMKEQIIVMDREFEANKRLIAKYKLILLAFATSIEEVEALLS